MKVTRRWTSSDSMPPGDYPFVVVEAWEEEHIRTPAQRKYCEEKGHDLDNPLTWMRVKLEGSDPKDPKVCLKSHQIFGDWNWEAHGGFLESLGIPSNASYEATDLIGLKGNAYWALGEPSTKEGKEGRRYLEPTDTMGAPGGFYPKDGMDNIRSDDHYKKPETEEPF